jgi:SulP family sulfate permease
LAAVLFIKRMSDLTESRILGGGGEHHAHPGLPAEIVIYDINGPMFFGAAQKALKVLRSVRKNTRVVILDMSDVPMLDMTGIVAIESIVSDSRENGIALIFNGLAPRMLLKLRRAGVRRQRGVLEYARGLEESRERALTILAAAKVSVGRPAPGNAEQTVARVTDVAGSTADGSGIPPGQSQ